MTYAGLYLSDSTPEDKTSTPRKSATAFTLAGEWLRVVEEPATIFGHTIPGVPGMRMVILSLLLLLVIIFRRQGLLGRWEFSWAGIGHLLRRAAGTPAPGSRV